MFARSQKTISFSGGEDCETVCDHAAFVQLLSPSARFRRYMARGMFPDANAALEGIDPEVRHVLLYALVAFFLP